MKEKKTEQKPKKKVVEKLFGRPPKTINKNVFENLCKLQCTEKEICAVLMVSENTLLKWCKDNYNGATFCDIFDTFKHAGKASLRRMQFEHAEKSPRMAIWLGKQWLGQREIMKDEEGGQGNVIDDFITAVINKGEDDGKH